MFAALVGLLPFWFGSRESWRSLSSPCVLEMKEIRPRNGKDRSRHGSRSLGKLGKLILRCLYSHPGTMTHLLQACTSSSLSLPSHSHCLQKPSRRADVWCHCSDTAWDAHISYQSAWVQVLTLLPVSASCSWAPCKAAVMAQILGSLTQIEFLVPGLGRVPP